MVALLGVLLFSAVYAISPEFRVGVLNLVVETLDESTDVSFGREETANNGAGMISRIEVRWLPEGYFLTEEGANASRIWNYFEDSHHSQIHIDVILGEGQVTSWNTENQVTKQVTIGEFVGVLSGTNDEQLLSLVDVNRSITISIWSNGLSEEEIEKVAENIYIF